MTKGNKTVTRIKDNNVLGSLISTENVSYSSQDWGLDFGKHFQIL